MIAPFKLDNLKNIVQEWAEFIGLGGLVPNEPIAFSTLDGTLSVWLLLKVELNPREEAHVTLQAKLREIKTAVQNSDCIVPLKIENQKLHAEIERLKQFETHFKIEHQLRHGEKPKG